MFAVCLYCSTVLASGLNYHSGPFIHPGMAQNASDLEYMKNQIEKGAPQWKLSFQNLKDQTDTAFVPKAQAHISVGAYGVNNNGGTALSKSAAMAHNCALMWYITKDRNYANKAIEILNTWAKTLWDFDDNNAKLSIGLTCYSFLNAAEILRYSDSNWKESDIKQFEKFLLLVYYPVIEDFFTEANGNWDASMINAMLCIGVFTENQDIFNRAVQRFYIGPGNSGITRYIYPSGQVQETTRDWAHVQLGLGELAKAAAVAWTQGLDLYGAAGNRLAKGYEHCAKFMLGDHNMPVYGILSQRDAEKFRDVYESVEDHYTNEKHLTLPYVQTLIEKHMRSKPSIGFLTGRRKPSAHQAKPSSLDYIPLPAVRDIVGASIDAKEKKHRNAIVVLPGEPIQEALFQAASQGRMVLLKAGVHELKKTLYIPSDIEISGEGRATILHAVPELKGFALVNAEPDFKNIRIRELLIEGATNVIANNDPNHDRRTRSYMSASNRGGIRFSAEYSGQAGFVSLVKVTVQNCTQSGLVIKGAVEVSIDSCDISDNGSSVVPGPGLHHNLVLSRVEHCSVKNSRFDASPWGNGIDLSFIKEADVWNNEIARNMLAGLYCSQITKASIQGNLAEGNSYGIRFNVFQDRFQEIVLKNNRCWYNAEAGISSVKIPKNDLETNNIITHNHDEIKN